jgi:hypothetical protein
MVDTNNTCTGGTNHSGGAQHTTNPMPISGDPSKDLGEAAYHGLTGDIVKAIIPHTEGNPAAVLIQFSAAFGNVIARNPYFVVCASPHYPNLFVTVVGKSAKARKGSSLSPVLALMAAVDEHWSQNRMQNGGSVSQRRWQVMRVISVCKLPGRLVAIGKADGTVEIRQLDPKVAGGDEWPLQILRAVVRALKSELAAAGIRGAAG